MNLRTLILMIAVVLGVQTLMARQDLPVFEQRVNDFTNTLSYNEWKSIENILKRFEDSTSTQIVILMVNSLHGQPIEDYAVKIFEKNKIGQKSRNNGVLLLIAKEERTFKIEVGYGLEGVLTDALCSQIAEREITPQFKQANFYGGIAAGVTSMIEATKGEYKAEPKGTIAPALSGGMLVLFVLFVVFVLMPIVATRRRTVIGAGAWNHYSGWSYGGGWGGSGSGSSSGGGWSGGGGMSGGGGARGSW